METVLDVHVQMLAAGGCRVASVRRGRDCPMPGMASSKGTTAGHGSVPRPSWWHICENMLRKYSILTKMLDP